MKTDENATQRNFTSDFMSCIQVTAVLGPVHTDNYYPILSEESFIG